jgi:hypothetical protein
MSNETKSGFESNGQGACRKCGLTRVPFGFMKEACTCVGSFQIVSDKETIEAVKKGRQKRADKTAAIMSV